ncbi:hypothetical protein [Trinickia violacea]|uniref:hypothetical protein n=1 Tax=Trinickia violacea TaxID=2571746 RepID=UPI0020C76020|nr:hypothetical protein [Trinickia violacea]
MRKTLGLMRRLIRNRCSTGLALGVLMLGMGATVTMYLVSSELVYRESRLRFDNDTSDAEQKIAMRVRLYSDVLVTMQALFGAKD